MESASLPHHLTGDFLAQGWKPGAKPLIRQGDGPTIQPQRRAEGLSGR